MPNTQTDLNRRRLYSVYQRIKHSKCCDEWKLDSNSFYSWYKRRLIEQKNKCSYCELKVPEILKLYQRKSFRKGRRGLHLEVDRKHCDRPYSPDNCVLACYPCNNAKSDVFSYNEFKQIGQAIRLVKNKSHLSHLSV